MDGLSQSSDILKMFFDNGVTETGLIALLALGLLITLALLISLRRGSAGQGEAQKDQKIEALNETVETLLTSHHALTGRLSEMSDAHSRHAADIGRTLNERLDGLTQRLGEGLHSHTEKTGESMAKLQERLAVIDQAQKTLMDLSTQMVGLQDILSNKQARGAFGEIQLNDLVTNVLPSDVYEFQKTLSNNRRADCFLKLPNPPGSMVIDAKFPLESFLALQDARDDLSRTQASRSFSSDVKKHIVDIADRYIIPGETADCAIMFLPSEAIYAELHSQFRGIVEEGFRRQVYVVSPSTLMATLNTIRAVLRDARMREQTGVIQKQVRLLLEDLNRLDERTDTLEKRFSAVSKGFDDIKKSVKGVRQHGEKIDSLKLPEETPADDLPATPSEQPRLTGIR